MWRDTIADNAAFSLDDAIDMAQFNYGENFRDHWGLEAAAPPDWLDHDAWLECRRLYGLAQAVAQSATTLVRQRGTGPRRLAESDLLEQEAKDFSSKLQDLLSKLEDPQTRRTLAQVLDPPFHPSDPRTKLSIVQNTLQVEVADAYPYYPARMAERLRALIDHLVTTSNPRVAEYLSRVARCFVLDMAPEFAVMSRAVLDVALQDMVTDAAARTEVGAGTHVTLDDRIRYCDPMGLFDQEERHAVLAVKGAGNFAAHGELDKVPSVEQLVRLLSTAMQRLVRFESAPK